METLPPHPTLSDYQAYVLTQCQKRGWTDRTDVERVMMLTEEIGEVAKEVRKHSGKFGYDKPDSSQDLGEELIDVLNWLIDLANSNNIDLDKAFRDKWQKTEQRTWPKND